MPQFSFTTSSNDGLLRQLINECVISEAWDPDGSAPRPAFRAFQALWDTGASMSAISQRVVDRCKLLPVGFIELHHAQGSTKDVPVYIVNIGLPNRIALPGVIVSLAQISSDQGIDVLIGMDVITQGDFAITNPMGNTKFSFRMPSIADIDFVEK